MIPFNVLWNECLEYFYMALVWKRYAEVNCVTLCLIVSCHLLLQVALSYLLHLTCSFLWWTHWGFWNSETHSMRIICPDTTFDLYAVGKNKCVDWGCMHLLQDSRHTVHQSSWCPHWPSGSSSHHLHPALWGEWNQTNSQNQVGSITLNISYVWSSSTFVILGCSLNHVASIAREWRRLRWGWNVIWVCFGWGGNRVHITQFTMSV